MQNQDLKQLAKQSGVYLWQIAHELGMVDTAFSRRLRFELPEAEKQEIRSIIERLSGQLVAK